MPMRNPTQFLPTARKRRWGGWLTPAMILVILAFSACSSATGTATAPLPTVTPADPTPSRQAQSQTPTHTSQATPSGTATQPPASHTPTLAPPTATATRTFTVTSTPPALPLFTTRLLRAGVSPVTYLTDPCESLRQRWMVENSAPGTVVVPMMFNSIVKADQVSDPKDITAAQFQEFVTAAQYMGFETITTAQVLAFLEHNAAIPALAMTLIVDDRRPGLLAEHFMPVLEANDWSVTPAYIADPDTFGWAMTWMEQLNATGRLDIQSHGYSGQLYMVEETPIEQVRSEIISATVVLEEHFGQRPLAFIWPGGNFTAAAVQVAREDGYRLGFSAYARGPLMFNWVPSGGPEQVIGDPLMTLPRFWSADLSLALSLGIQIGEAAREAARQNYPEEAQYYRTYCGGELPALEKILSPTQIP